MAEQKLVPGIRILISPQKRGVGIDVKFFIDQGVSAKDFVTNKEIRALIESNNLKQNYSLGYAKLDYVKKYALAVFFSFYPFNAVPHLAKAKKGVGQLLEYRILEHFRKAFKGVEFIAHPSSNTLRENALYRRYDTKILIHEIKSDYSFDDALKYLRQKIARDTLKGRGITPRPLRRK